MRGDESRSTNGDREPRVEEGTPTGITYFIAIYAIVQYYITLVLGLGRITAQSN